MNKMVLGSIVLSGKNFTFTTPNLGLYSTAAYGQLVEPEVEITISDSLGKLNPYIETGYYTKDTLRGELVKCYDYYDNVIYTGFVTRFNSRGTDLIIYVQSPLAYGMSRNISVATTRVYPSTAIYEALLSAGLQEFIDEGSFIGANAYYQKYPQLVTIDTTTSDVKLVDIINSVSKLSTSSVCCNEDGKIEFKVLGAFVPIPSITITANDMLTEPSKDEEIEAFNTYQIQILDDSNVVAKSSVVGSSASQYGTLNYNYSPSSGVYVSDFGSGVIFGERKTMYQQYPLRKLIVGIKNDILAPMHNEVDIEYINESYNGTYLIASKKFDAYVTELTLVEVPKDRIEASLDYLEYANDFGYGYGIYNTRTWGR